VFKATALLKASFCASRYALSTGLKALLKQKNTHLRLKAKKHRRTGDG
jgi:hypothetical protein